MLDLKAKLAAAGLVTAADVAAAERKGAGRGPDRKSGPDRDAGKRPAGSAGPGSAGPGSGAPSGKPGRPAGKPAPAAGKPGLDVAALKRGGKGEAYDAIRRAVDRGRLDAAHAIPGEHAEAFHFTTATGQLSRLMLEPDVRAKLSEGSAGIVAFMSHHGLAHCVAPRPLAEAVAEVFPLWLRVLKDHPGAGQLEPPKPRPAPADAADAAAAPPAADLPAASE